MLPVWYCVCSYDKSCVSWKLQWWRMWGRMSSLLSQDQCQRKKILRDKPTYAKSTWTKHTLRCRYFFSHLMKCGHCFCNESLVYCRKGNKIQSFHFAPRFSYYTTKASSFLKKLVCSVTLLLRRNKYFPGQSLCLQFWRWELQLWWEKPVHGRPLFLRDWLFLLWPYFAAAGNLAAHFSWSLMVHCCGYGMFGAKEIFSWHLSLLGVKMHWRVV